MSKTTFLGYVPSLKEKHEATIVEGKAIESKGGSIRYTLRGEYEGRKTLPKTVSKADFENVYGFDAKEAEGVLIVGKKDGQAHSITHNVGEKDKTGFTPMKGGILTTDEPIGEHLKDDSLNYQSDTVGEPSPASVEPPAPSDTPFPQEPSNENFSAEIDWANLKVGDEVYGRTVIGVDCSDCGKPFLDDLMDDEGTSWPVCRGHFPHCESCGIESHEVSDGFCIDCEPIETKEAFLGFGDDEDEDEEEEKEEEKPKEQEFTVIMQEGDKLELTDIEEKEETEEEPKDEDNGEDEENDEKEEEDDESEAEMDKGILMICPSCDETVPEYSSCMACGQQFRSEDFDFVGWIPEADNPDTCFICGKSNQGFEGSDNVCTTCDESWFYDEGGEEGEGYYLKETKRAVSAKVTRPVKEEEKEEEPEDEEGMSTLMKVGLGVGALAVGAAILGAEEQVAVMWEGKDDNNDGLIYGIEYYGEDGEFSDVEWFRTAAERDAMMLDNEGESDYWEGENAHWRAEGSGEDFQNMTSSEFVPFDQITAEIQEEWDETTVPVAADYEPLNEPTNANFSAEEMAQCQGCGQMEYANMIFHTRKDDYCFTCFQEKIYPNLTEMEQMHYSPYMERFAANTVGSPSPSGPSSVPEPAEATGSEPSNEHMEAETDNMKLVLGITAVGIGLAAVLGKDKLTKLFDRFGL